MHKAIMEYTFNEKDFEKGCALWKSMIFEKAINQEGLIRMVLLTNKPKALALGIWETKEQAQKFMSTGVFTDFLKASSSFLSQQPNKDAWEISAFY